MYLLYSFLLSVSISLTYSTRPVEFDWLIGTWQNTESKDSFESWIWNENTQRHEGKGYRIVTRDTLVFETLYIEKIKDTFYYTAIVEDNDGAVPFKMSNISKKGFSSENTKHDFPKTIAYQNKAGKLVATITGNGKVVNFSFRKIK